MVEGWVVLVVINGADEEGQVMATGGHYVGGKQSSDGILRTITGSIRVLTRLALRKKKFHLR